MATRVSPGVSVTVKNDSFYSPQIATTIPVFFIATKAGKLQVDGISPALGTQESNVVRTVTSIPQSLELYGLPSFREDSAGNQLHGDPRNEYGLLALNQFLGIGGRAYVVRADIDLDDEEPETFVSLGVPVLVSSSVDFAGLGNGVLSAVTCTNNKVKPQTFTVQFNDDTNFTVRGSEVGYVGTGNVDTPFTSNQVNLTVTAGSTEFVSGDTFFFRTEYNGAATVGNVGNGKFVGLITDELSVAENWTITFTSTTDFDVVGSVSGSTGSGTVGVPYDNNRINFTINAGSTAFAADDEFTVTSTLVTLNDPLGSTNAARRQAIVTSLQAAINSNQEIRSSLYEVNLVACPGFPEVGDEITNMIVDMREEVFGVIDSPCNLNPEQTAAWALSSNRQRSANIAYYYPWCLVSNLDGKDVLAAPSGIAMRTIAYSDNQAYIWTAPAGINRGLVTGVSKVGYVTGAIGTATKFVEANLSESQIANMYEYDKNINPIVFEPDVGTYINGQKTSVPAASSLDRITGSRTICHLRRVLRKLGRPFLFQPNDQNTRDNLKSAADDRLNDILAKGGLYDYATVCDTTNNTASRIDNNEMWLDVGVKLKKDVEFIYIPIKVVKTGDTL